MKEKLLALQSEIAAKSAERDKLLAKGADVTQEDILNAQKLNGEIEAKMAEAESLHGVLKTADAQRTALKTPVDTFNYGQSANSAQVLGVSGKAGETQISFNEKTGDYVIESDGEGFLSDKQAKTIKDPAYKRAFRAYCRAKGQFGLMGRQDLATLQEGVDSEGGFLVPEEFMNRIIQKQPAPTRVNSRVSSFTTGRDSLTIPKVNYTTDDIYTTGIRVTLTGEVPASATTARVTDPVFGQVRIDVGTYMMSLPLTNDIVEDSMFPLLPWASGKFDETIDLLYDDQIINGTGIGVRPDGILKNPGGTDEPAVYLSGTGGNIDPDQLRKGPFQLPEQYINTNTCWVMNRASTGAAISDFKDSQNRFLFNFGVQDSGLASRVPDQLIGYPIVYSAFMPNIGSSNYPIIFGDLSGFYKVMRVGFSIRILNELYAETNQLLMLGRLRWGGKVAEPFRMQAYKSNNS